MKHNIYSDMKIFGFPEKIRSFREGTITAPIYVRIKPTNRCMHACHWCVYSDGHTRPKDRPERPFTRCLYMQTVPVVGADLNVYACHNTAYSEHGLIGSMRHQRFRDLWFSPEARARFDALNPSISCRHECANHSKVDLFNRLAESSSDNFV